MKIDSEKFVEWRTVKIQGFTRPIPEAEENPRAHGGVEVTEIRWDPFKDRWYIRAVNENQGSREIGSPQRIAEKLVGILVEDAVEAGILAKEDV